MRTVLAALAVTAAVIATLPAQAQGNYAPNNMAAQRQPLPFPRMLEEGEDYPRGNFTQIPATDGQSRPLIIMVTAPQASNRQPYRAIVAWAGAPDHYWNMAFTFDCTSRSLGRVETVKRRWQSRYKANESFPVGDTFRGDFASLVAPVICDGQTGTVTAGFERSLSFAEDYIHPPKG